MIVPVYNDSEGIETTVKSIQPQLDDRSELIIIDNNSTDETAGVISEIAGNDERILLKSETDIQSSYAARNTGIRASTGEILAFVDADMTVSKSWLSDLRDLFRLSDINYAGFNVELYLPEGKKSFAGQYNVACGFPVESYLEREQFAPTCCLAVRRGVIDEVGMFDETLTSGGDREFGQRVSRAGFEQHYAEDITVYHPARTTFEELKLKSLRVGRGNGQLYEKGHRSRSVLNIKNVLPPHPKNFYSKIEDDQPMSTLFAWYLINYWCKLTILRGWASYRFVES